MENTENKTIRFLGTVFKDLLDESGTLIDNQHIRIWSKFVDNLFFRSLSDIAKYLSKTKADVYFQLATSNGISGQAENLISRTVLCFDFDKKDMPLGYNHKDVIAAFKSINLRYHILIDSGHGYHVYTFIDATQDLAKVQEVQTRLAEKLNADRAATLQTQIMRLPGTLNAKKTENITISKIVFIDSNIKQISINALYNRYCGGAASNKVSKQVLNSKYLPPCLQDMINNGTPIGARNRTLLQLVVTLRRSGLSEKAVLEVAKEWADKSGFNDRLEYRVNYIYNKQHHIAYDCKGCNQSSGCFDYTAPDIAEFNLEDDSVKLRMHEGLTQSLKKPRRKDTRVLTGNDILVIGVLKTHNDGLFLSELKTEMTYQDKCVLGDNTLRSTLKSLVNKNIIDCKTIEGRKFYRYIDHPGESIDLVYFVSYAAIDKAITKEITPEELRLYIYMRHLQSKSQREDRNALKGSLFSWRQKDLAEAIGVDQSRVSRMINNLIAVRMLKIWYRNPSKRNGFDYYTYRLMY